MIILSIDTSTQAATAAVMSDDKLICEYTILNKKTHSQNIMPMIDEMLAKADITLDDIDVFAVAVGPGSFTGLRIGMATAKTFAQAKSKPIIGVSTLKGLSENVSCCGMTICPIIDARRGDVYNALFKNGECICDDRALNIEELISEIKDDDVLFLGDGVEVHKELIMEKMGSKAHFAPINAMHCKASSICEAAYKMARESMFSDPYSLNPVYLRVSQAEREYAEKHK